MQDILKKLDHLSITFFPSFHPITGSLAASLLLSYLLQHPDRDSKICCVDSWIMKRTSLTICELRSAKKKIKNLGLIKVTREGFPAKTFYEIDWRCLKKIINRDQ